MRSKPVAISDFLEKRFDVSKMETGMKRGMVLKLAPAKIKESLGGKADFAKHLKNIKLTGKDDNPMLVINLRSGSIYRVPIHQCRYQIKKKINERLKDEFIRDVRVY